MKILVTMTATLDTDKIRERPVKLAIERSAFSKQKDSLAGMWALDEVACTGVRTEITLDLL